MPIWNKERKLDKTRLFAYAVSSIFLILASFFSGIMYADKNPWLSAYKDNSIWGRLTGKEIANAKDNGFDQDLFWSVWSTLKTNYVDSDKLSDKDMMYGSLSGMAQSTGDPYTVFMTPTTSKAFQDDMAGSFEGIGAEITLKNEIITVVSPLDDMPAKKAGIKAGDKILKIDGLSTQGMSTNEAVSKIRGKKDTFVTLTISRDNEKPFDVKIKRGTIKVKSVKTEIKDGVFVIRVSSFNDDTEQLFNEAVDKAVTAKPKGIILDLRNNPGGYLQTAIKMSSAWVEKGTVVSEKYGDGHVEASLAQGVARLKNFKTVVLINEGSASASEIVAGALQDYKLATVVGMKSFGKGSVQMLKTFSDGSTLKVTTAKWLTPNGKNINKEGISPDVKVEFSKKDSDAGKDPQMSKALEVIKKGSNSLKK